MVTFASAVLICEFVAVGAGKDCGSDREFEVKFALDLVREASARRDGALGATIDSAIVELLLVNPRETLKWLATNSSAANQLVDNLQYSVFTDYVGSMAVELRELRSRLICVLRSLQPTDPAVARERDRLLAKAITIQVRSID